MLLLMLLLFFCCCCDVFVLLWLFSYSVVPWGAGFTLSLLGPPLGQNCITRPAEVRWYVSTFADHCEQIKRPMWFPKMSAVPPQTALRLTIHILVPPGLCFGQFKECMRCKKHFRLLCMDVCETRPPDRHTDHLVS